MSNIILTGATGFLGQELYTQLKSSGHHVLGMSRHGPDIYYDITDRFIPKIDKDFKIDVIIHSAALLSFSPKHTDQVNNVNIHGTAHICDLVRHYYIPKVVYISTAYVCGNFDGEWKESYLDKGQKFKNPYEKSKFSGEMLIRSIPNYLIFRPSIIIGNSISGKATDFDGFYRPVRAIARTMKFFEHTVELPPRERSEEVLHLPKLHVPLTINGNPDSTLNLVPVDWVASRIVNNLDLEGTYHLTNPNPLKNSEIAEIINSELGITGPHFELGNHNHGPQDTLYQRMTKDFSPYLQNEVKFQSSLNSSEVLTTDNKRYIINSVRYWRGSGVR
jgi:nucleoside-diphosphate-sugar epimerase